MPYYIATVYTSDSRDADQQPRLIRRRVLRESASSPQTFQVWCVGQVDDHGLCTEVEFGPIGLSKHQGADRV